MHRAHGDAQRSDLVRCVESDVRWSVTHAGARARNRPRCVQYACTDIGSTKNISISQYVTVALDPINHRAGGLPYILPRRAERVRSRSPQPRSGGGGVRQQRGEGGLGRAASPARPSPAFAALRRPLPQRGEGKRNRSRGASAPELCLIRSLQQRREAERRQAHPTMIRANGRGSGLTADKFTQSAQTIRASPLASRRSTAALG
jgi:hypothetical protein